MATKIFSKLIIKTKEGMVLPVLASDPVSASVGETYFSSTLGAQRTYDGTQWKTSGGEVVLEGQVLPENSILGGGASDLSVAIDTLNQGDVLVSEAGLTLKKTYIESSEKGAINGVATLDANGRLPLAQLPTEVMTFEGTWDASTNTPELANGVGDAGMVYIVSVAGTVDFGAGPIDFEVKDWAVYNGSVWEKVANTNPEVAVLSVNGQVGAVVLTKTDIGLDQVDNTSDLNKPISSATQDALGLKANASDLDEYLKRDGSRSMEGDLNFQSNFAFQIDDSSNFVDILKSMDTAGLLTINSFLLKSTDGLVINDFSNNLDSASYITIDDVVYPITSVSSNGGYFAMDTLGSITIVGADPIFISAGNALLTLTDNSITVYLNGVGETPAAIFTPDTVLATGRVNASYKVTGMDDGVNPNDGVNKSQLDAAIASVDGLPSGIEGQSIVYNASNVGEAKFLDTDDVSEGSNQYFTQQRVNTTVFDTTNDTATIESASAGAGDISFQVKDASLTNAHIAVDAEIAISKLGEVETSASALAQEGDILVADANAKIVSSSVKLASLITKAPRISDVIPSTSTSTIATIVLDTTKASSIEVRYEVLNDDVVPQCVRTGRLTILAMVDGTSDISDVGVSLGVVVDGVEFSTNATNIGTTYVSVDVVAHNPTASAFSIRYYVEPFDY